MCGFVGFCNLKKKVSDDTDTLTKMTRILQKRGPSEDHPRHRAEARRDTGHEGRGPGLGPVAEGLAAGGPERQAHPLHPGRAGG